MRYCCNSHGPVSVPVVEQGQRDIGPTTEDYTRNTSRGVISPDVRAFHESPLGCETFFDAGFVNWRENSK